MNAAFVGRFFGLVLVAALFSACGQVNKFPRDALAQPPEKVPSLEVVHTWKELAGQPIVGSGPNAARVGIEARRCDEETGLLVYCLPVRAASGAVEESQLQNPLGPLAIRVVSLDHHEAELDSTPVKLDGLDGLGGLSQVAFFAGGAAVGAAGHYRVEVMDATGTVLAATTVEAVKTKGSPWLPVEVKEFAEDPKPSTCTLWQMAARPRWDGSLPMPPTDRLPMFFPGAPDGTLDVSVRNGVVKVKSAEWVDDHIQDHWLIRWWVNGRPVLRRSGERPFPVELEDMSETITEPVEFSFILQVDLAALRARPQDRLEFQLLYCRDGVAFLPDEDGLASLVKIPVEAGVRMSQRIVWQP